MTELIKQMMKKIDLKDGKKFLAPVYVEEQMLLPTLEVYLSTAVTVPSIAKKRAPRRQRASATVCVWERLF